MDNKQIALKMAEFLNSRKAIDISVIDIAEKSGFADYFIIATAGSLRQMRALADDLDDEMSKSDIFTDHIEGKGESGWILMDYKDVIVNIFTEEKRQHYNIDKIWKDCAVIDTDFDER